MLDLKHGGLLFLKTKYPYQAPRHLRPEKNAVDFQRNHYLRMQKKQHYSKSHSASCYCKFIYIYILLYIFNNN